MAGFLAHLTLRLLDSRKVWGVPNCFFILIPTNNPLCGLGCAGVVTSVHVQSNLLVSNLKAHQICTSYQRHLLSVLVDIMYMS